MFNFYGFVYSLGFFLFYYFINKTHIEKKDFYFFISFLFSILFARIVHILDPNNLDYYLQNPINMIEIWKGGLAWFGGVIGFTIAQITYLIFSKKREKEKKEIIKLINKTILFVPIFIMIGRIANFFNNENCGIGFLGLPQQIFESLTQGLVVFLVVLFSQNRIESFIISYMILRLITEYFRYSVGIKITHFLVIFISFLILIIYRKIKN